MKKEITNKDLLEAMNIFSESVDKRFENIESDIGSMKFEIGSIKSQMVTKSYLDDKLADLKGDLIAVIRKQGVKVGALITTILGNNGMTIDQANHLLGLSPFPKSI